MSLKHKTVKAPGEKLFAVADWNEEHNVDGNAGEVLFQGAAAIIETDPELLWDNVNKRLTVTRLLGKAGDALKVGTGNDNHSLTSPNDLFVTGKLEVDGAVYYDGDFYPGGDIYVIPTGNRIITTSAQNAFRFFDGLYTSFYWAWWRDDGTHFGLNDHDGGGNSNLIITSDDYVLRDHDHDTLSPDPTLFIHARTNPDIDNTQWISFTHNKADGVITTGKGDLKFVPVGVISFGTYAAGVASESTGYITVKDAAGNTRKLMVQA